MPALSDLPAQPALERGGSDESQSIATIRSAVDRGVTLIDTAPVYGFGRAEEIVGKALARADCAGV